MTEATTSRAEIFIVLGQSFGFGAVQVAVLIRLAQVAATKDGET
jgi:hypothetical protein